MKLRKYQKQSANDVHGAWYGNKPMKRVLKVLATGLGKTIIATKMLEYYSANYGRCLFLVHRDRLLTQTVEKLTSSTGLHCAIEKRKESALGSMFDITVGSVQTMVQKRLDQFPRDFYSHIIVDEAHRSASPSYTRILDHFNEAKVMGLTATAYRGDKKSLGEVYDGIAGEEFNLKWAVDNGYLVPVVAQTVQVDIDASLLRGTGQDYTLNTVDDTITPYLVPIAQEIVRVASDRKIIIFLPLVKTSIAMCEAMTNAGMTACHVDGKDSSMLQAFEDGEYQVCCNSQLLSEGVDILDVDCVVPLRITKSTGRYTQEVGRGTRLIDPAIGALDTPCERREAIANSSKPNMLLLDFLMHGADHNLCHPAVLYASNEEEAEKMTDNMSSGEQCELGEAEVLAQNDIINERESKLISMLQSLSGKDSQNYDPVVECLSLFSDSISSWEPSFAWEKEAISEKQRETLDQNGFKCDSWTKGFASQVLDAISTRREQSLATPKQVRAMVRGGVPNAQRMTFDEAKVAMDGLAKTWKKAKLYKKHKARRK